jgi:hypothetical protein
VTSRAARGRTATCPNRRPCRPRTPGEPVAHVVLRQQHVSNTVEHLGLVGPDPQDLRGGEPGQGVVAGRRDELGTTDQAADLVALRLGALVVPEDRGPQHLPAVVEQDQAVHLPGEADRAHLRAGEPRLGERRSDRHDRRVPPQGRGLLRPQRVGRVDVVVRPADGDDGAVRVHHERLRRRRRGVDAEVVGHVVPFSPLRGCCASTTGGSASSGAGAGPSRRRRPRPRPAACRPARACPGCARPPSRTRSRCHRDTGC